MNLNRKTLVTLPPNILQMGVFYFDMKANIWFIKTYNKMYVKNVRRFSLYLQLLGTKFNLFVFDFSKTFNTC